ncbi:response regulator transcription factor [Luteipulveratus sp. YIM 133132]|uniref:Response regulator transcription factor n=1 Tax=Luteipulveratus flavus TaxID=3031728 RepID=A0ABT6C6K7_9MICO|nr:MULTISPECIES: response regulator transcription factor [unclassified Luteipulveratus]MDE9365090.1 response regulator transcription factor [Luteipulveratus sp. YIM 133132]MDF8264574.1 response regulator transcription factor [Luteipulveratus sp. YIM 133296]
MRVVLAEDQFLLRDGLIRLLSSHGIEVVAAVDHGDAIVPAIVEHRPDLALLDVRLPPRQTDEGLRAALAAREAVPDLPVVLLSQYVEQLYVEELLAGERGGVGYLLKDRVFDDVQFVTALHAVQQGGTVLDPEVVKALMNRNREAGVLGRLTARELEVLALMAEGHSNAVIAERLVVTEKAVAKHINSILAKLDLPPSTTTSRRVAAVLTYLRA